MKILKTASGKSQIKISKSEWQSIGKKAGWEEDSSTIHPREQILNALNGSLFVWTGEFGKELDELNIQGEERTLIFSLFNKHLNEALKNIRGDLGLPPE